MIVKHTLSGEHGLTWEEVMQDIMNCNLDIRIEGDPDGLLLIGDSDHIEYLIKECYML